MLRLFGKQLQINMKKARTLLCAMSLIVTTVIIAQEHENEEKMVELSEVTVKATPVIRKADRDLYIPSDETKKRSSDGLDMLNNMQIPTLTVNTVLNTINRAGESVEVRINGRKADISQVKTLAPSSIIRVEYHDNPGLRYGNATAVLDFIVRNPNSGGSLRTNVMQSLSNGFGNQWLNLKLNTGRSQFEANYYGHMRLDLPMYRENAEFYTLPDGTSFSRMESALGGNHDTYDANGYLAYNYLNPDKTNFYVSFSYNRSTSNLMSFDGLLTTSDDSPEVKIHDATRSPNTSPNLNLYLDHKLGNGQTIIFDVNAGCYIGQSIRDYSETIVDDGIELVDINTCIDERNFAFVAEGDYIKEWSKSKLNIGTGYSGKWNRSEYTWLDGLVNRQREDRIFLFGEYLQRFGKLSLSAGATATYTNTRIVDADNKVENFLVRPRVVASYRLNNTSQFRLTFNTYTGSPTLNQMSSIPQEIDGLQMQVGNANLDPYNSYRVMLQYNYSSAQISGQLSTYYYRSPDAIMDYRYWNDDGKIVTSYANQSGVTSWGVQLAPRVTVIPKWMTISGLLRFHRDYTRGLGYRHCMGSIDGSAQLQITHYGFTLTAQYQKGSKSLWGETITEGETVNVIGLSYRWKGFSFDAGMLMPVGRYRQGTETLNRYAEVKRTLRTKSVEQVPFISVSYNFDWGRKTRQTSKLIDSDAGVQQTSTAGK